MRLHKRTVLAVRLLDEVDRATLEQLCEGSGLTPGQQATVLVRQQLARERERLRDHRNGLHLHPSPD